ncbi:cytochrome b/b6 domain-containing protein [Desulfohalobiaceae bacterium Ax17]|jgi:thiosulfate reductase cytochrome b subunit|uniref:cytochrome b/b6 domain-containing protein n=1 Tax=Desulfovulcanus ferrireducens TaxID=2831190 RepID=UPI00207BB8BC|nr:cytochrome b/b6 domain-containing protein [Desulfovulcanus ferrireducens]MBT8764486.1 cytochrome b/b6 domain-containing protein [Desulfovulcanus ferrireducens]
MEKIYLYTRFERFWHWAQALLIILLALTGFEIHSSYTLFGFEKAFEIHNFCAWAWLILYAFIVFWILTTGEWRQYVPTFQKLFQVAKYYVSGIFKGEPHPVPKSKRTKHNPLQRLTYLAIVSFLVPYQIITGFIYYYYNQWPEWGINLSLKTIAFLHTAGAFAMVTFVIVHIYMTTTGHTIFAHIKAMFTGWEEVEDITAVPKWEIKTKS